MGLITAYPEFLNHVDPEIIYSYYNEIIIDKTFNPSINIYNLYIVKGDNTIKFKDFPYKDTYLIKYNFKDYLSPSALLYYDEMKNYIKKSEISSRHYIEYYDMGIKLLDYSKTDESLISLISLFIYYKYKTMFEGLLPFHNLNAFQGHLIALSTINFPVELPDVYHMKMFHMKKKFFYKFLDNNYNEYDFWKYMTQWHVIDKEHIEYDVYKNFRRIWYNKWYYKWITLFQYKEIFDLPYNWKDEIGEIKRLIYYKSTTPSFLNKKFLTDFEYGTWYYYKDR